MAEEIKEQKLQTAVKKTKEEDADTFGGFIRDRSRERPIAFGIARLQLEEILGAGQQVADGQ